MMQVTWNETKENGGKTILLHVWALRFLYLNYRRIDIILFYSYGYYLMFSVSKRLKTILCLRLTEAFDKDLDLRNF